MVFTDFFKDAANAVSVVVHGNDDTAVTAVDRKVMVARPPGDGALVGRGASWVADRVKREGGGNCLLIDTAGGYEELTTIYEGPVGVFQGTISLQIVWSVVKAVDDHLQSDPNATVCFLDPVGMRSKTAVYIICHTLFTNLYSDVSKAIEYYKAKRRLPNLTFLPSHLRYIEYFKAKLHDTVFTPPGVQPAFIRLITLRHVPVSVALKKKLSLEIEHVRTVFKDGDTGSLKARTVLSNVYTPGTDGIIPARDLSGAVKVDIEVLVNTNVEEDFRVVVWCVNEYRRAEELFSAQVHTSYLFGEYENGVVLPLGWQDGDMCNELGKDFSIEIDVVSERHREPTVEECGSMWIVSNPPPPPLLEQSRYTEPPLSPRFDPTPPGSPTRPKRGAMPRPPSSVLFQSCISTVSERTAK